MHRLVLCLLILLPLGAFAAEKPVPVPLKNAGFEEGLKEWAEEAEALAEVMKADSDSFRAGKNSLWLQGGPGQSPMVSQKAEGIEPGAQYAVRIWYKGALEGESCAALRLEFEGPQGQILGGHHVRRLADKEQWQQLAVEAQAPAETAAARVYLRVLGNTEVWFDDVEMIRVKAAPALVGAPARLAFVAGQPGKAQLTVTAREDLPEDLKPQLTALGPNVKPVALTGELTRQDARTYTGEISFASLPQGTTTWRAKFGSNAAEGRFFATLPERKPKALTDQGIFQLRGNPFFPIGIYHAASGDYPLLYERGFNSVQGVGTNNSGVSRSAVAQAEQSKLAVQMPLHTGGMVGANLTASQGKLQFFAKSQSVLMWKIADEPDQHFEIMDEVPETYLRLKQKEALRPLGLAVADPAAFPYWANFCDVLEVPVFPLPGQPLGLVGERIAAARAALQPWQGLVAVLQAGWVPDNSNQPTLQQARVMVYQALINGAKGIFWYALRDAGWQLTDSPLWGQFKELNEETARLGDFITTSPMAQVESDNPKLQAAAWPVGERLHVLLVNPEAEAQAATLKLPRAADRAEVVKGQAEVEVKEGALVVKVEAGTAVHLVIGPEGYVEPEKPKAEEPAPDSQEEGVAPEGTDLPLPVRPAKPEKGKKPPPPPPAPAPAAEGEAQG